MSSALQNGARPQFAFREVNERITELAGEWNETGFNLVICECGRIECAEALEITAAEYEAVRADGARFVVSPGHQQAGKQRVIGGNGRFVIVEVLGETGQMARKVNPPHREENQE